MKQEKFVTFVAILVDAIDRHAPPKAARKIIRELWQALPKKTNFDELSTTLDGHRAGTRLLRDKYRLWGWNPLRGLPDFAEPHQDYNRL